MQFNKKTVFIALFAVLYLAVGLVSTIHAVSFFGLANAPILGIILAITFEIGQAAVLFNLLTSPSQRKKFMPWALMCILTLVQILGNIFSSYKYLITNSTEDLRYFKEPIFVWTELPDQQCNVIITYIVGAILPIVALCLTEMVVSYLNNEDEPKKEDLQTQINHVDFNPNGVEIEEQSEGEDESQIITPEDITKLNDKLVKEFEEQNKEQNEVIETNDIQEEEIVETIPEQEEQNIEQEPSQTDVDDDLSEQEPIIEPEPVIIEQPEPVITQDTKQAVDELLTGNVKQTNVKPIKSSHFINI